MSSSNPAASPVLLTGANGFIGFQITRFLLEKGYDVVGTVRSESKTKYLTEKFSKFANGDKPKLRFAVVEDIAKPGAFDQVLKENNFNAVIHSSSPFFQTAKDIEKQLYEPAIEGTVGILKSIHAHAPSVKRVVITSSFASIMNKEKGNWPEHAYTEEDWNPITREQGLQDPAVGYTASKKLAEEAAWDFVKKQKPSFSLTTICPPMVYGPPEQEVTDLSKLNTSAADMYALFTGQKEASNQAWIWVDVRDVALAHVLAIVSPPLLSAPSVKSINASSYQLQESSAAPNQRYLISSGRYSAQQFLNYIWENYPDRAKAKKISKGTPGKLYPEEGTYTSDNTKSRKDLGLTYRDLDTMMDDTFGRFKELEAIIDQN
ncbi:methylglyoxal reductase (NADPH-dependent) gre2 [Tulasnella sp. 427]|nr:methylglyoxal reductase (NADPH-dependent) gre2 [Tulasnella sp. 427]